MSQLRLFVRQAFRCPKKRIWCVVADVEKQRHTADETQPPVKAAIDSSFVSPGGLLPTTVVDLALVSFCRTYYRADDL